MAASNDSIIIVSIRRKLEQLHPDIYYLRKNIFTIIEFYCYPSGLWNEIEAMDGSEKLKTCTFLWENGKKMATFEIYNNKSFLIKTDRK